MATNQQKLDRLYELAENYLDTKSSHIAGHILDATVKDEKTGRNTNLRTKIAWLAHEQHKVDRVLENQAALNAKLDAILELLTPTEEPKEQP